MKKSIIYIFICLFSVLLMSHNVFAFSVDQNVDIKQVIYNPRTSFYNGSTWTDYAYGTQTFTSRSGNFTQMRISKADFYSINNFEVGDYIILNGFFSVNQVVTNSTLSNTGGFIGTNYFGVSCLIVDFHFGAVQEYSQSSSGASDSSRWYRADFQFTCKVLSESYNQSINFRVRPDIVSVSGTKLNINFTSGIVASPSSDINQEQEEATQEAADNSATSGSNSSSNSQTATSSLLSVITSGIGAITSASPTNCKINGNMGNLNVGNIDLCANPVPTFMTIIGSIIAVLVVLPLVILLFNRFISIIRSFQR